MTALTIGTYLPIPIRAEALRRQSREVGSREVAFDGTTRLSRRARKTDFSFELPPMSVEEAEAWDGMLSGLGHYWSFATSLYSSKGLGPFGAPTAARAAGGNAKADTGYLEFSGAKTITYAAQLGTRWTISLWRDADGAAGGTAYTHYVVRSDGAKWVDGVRNDAASTTWLSVSGGAMVLTDTNTDMDSIHACPYLWHTSWPALIYQWAGVEYAPLPHLILVGDALPGSASATRTYVGEVSGAELLGGRESGGSFSDVYQRLSVTLTEI